MEMINCALCGKLVSIHEIYVTEEHFEVVEKDGTIGEFPDETVCGGLLLRPIRATNKQIRREQ